MGALRSAIEEVTSTHLTGMSDDELHEEAIEVSRAIDVFEHRLAEVSDRAGSVAPIAVVAISVSRAGSPTPPISTTRRRVV